MRINEVEPKAQFAAGSVSVHEPVYPLLYSPSERRTRKAKLSEEFAPERAYFLARYIKHLKLVVYMRILKEGGNYLEEQRKSNQNIAVVFLIIGLATLIFYGLGIIFIGISVYFFIKSGQYKKGESGETLIEENLQRLSDSYYLLNDVVLPESYGNIDHIILGPNGIFVIETKNYDGKIICNGDEWHRQYEGGLTISMRGRPYWKPPRDYNIGSPSKQVKRNAVKLKQFIQKAFKKPVWVEGIVVFTNPNAELELNNPTVPILKIEELYDFIKNKKSRIKFSSKELESIAKLIRRSSK